MSREYDLGIFIGRFQPLHRGHEWIISKSLERVDRLILLIGSSRQARDTRNPFTFDERKEMVRLAFPNEVEQGRIICLPLRDNPYSDEGWIASVQSWVKETILNLMNPLRGPFRGLGTADIKVALCGCNKDNSSYYLKLFPQWDNITIDQPEVMHDATTTRNYLFGQYPGILEMEAQDPKYYGERDGLPNVSPVIKDVIKLWCQGGWMLESKDTYSHLVEEWKFLQNYKRQWGSGPFVTADAIVVQSGHILLVTRGKHPGKGLLALPGGFLDVKKQERIRTASVRELWEEAQPEDEKGLMPKGILASFIDDDATRVFDWPHRDLRAQIITHAYLYRFPNKTELYKVSGKPIIIDGEEINDTIDAGWYPIGELDPEKMYGDHYNIIETMLDL